MLIEPHYFSGVYEGKDNEQLWDEVLEYIDSKYDLEQIEHIYLNSDGGGWIVLFVWAKRVTIYNCGDEVWIITGSNKTAAQPYDCAALS